MHISQYFLRGDVRGAIAHMRAHEEFRDVLPAYLAIFENCEYRTYGIPAPLNDILRLYQIYFRDTFYCGLPEAEAADKLLARLKKRLDLPDADEARLTERLQAAFEAEGYHALFGKTQGYYGPYVWRETVPAVYQVELPDGSAEYTVNLLKGFVFRSFLRRPSGCLRPMGTTAPGCGPLPPRNSVARLRNSRRSRRRNRNKESE